MSAVGILIFTGVFFLLISTAGGFSVATTLAALALISIFLLSKWKPKFCSVDPKGRAIIVTGCDSGFGFLLAKKLDSLGFVVFGTLLFPDGEGAQKLKLNCSSRLKTMKCDVTEDEDVESFKKFVECNAPEKGVWGLVNNAGISKWGEVEWNTVHDYKRVAEINLFGSIRTTLAFIPLIKKSKGRMVFMSSTNAIITPQCNSIYCVTKRGLEAFCDSLRIEMKKFGVIVCVVRPGDFTSATKILKKQTAEDIWSTFSEDVKQVYSKEYVDTYIKSIDMRLKRQSRDPDEVVSTVVKTLMISNPNAVWTVASVAETSLAFICSYFPYSVLVPLFYSLGGEKERRVLINQ